MPGSLVVGHRIADVTTREYLVAAIYRDGELVVPHGDTVVEAGDQVLLVGDPGTLRAIADYFRLGAAQFPRQFGRAVILWDPTGKSEVRDEALWLHRVTAVPDCFELLEPGATASRDHLEPPPLEFEANARLRYTPLTDAHPALYVLRAPRISLFRKEGMEPLLALLNQDPSPILLSRGTAPYRRILVPVSNSKTAWIGLELALDIARLLEARVTALHVAQPSYLGGTRGEERVVNLRHQVDHIAKLYDLDFELRVVEGNPIRQVADAAADHQLVVVSRNPKQANTYLEPDVGLRIALAAPCSVVLLHR